MSDHFVPYRVGYAYGMGVESASGDRTEKGVKGVDEPLTGSIGGSSTFKMTQVQSMSEMEDALSISAEASGGVGLFSANGRFNFAKSAKIQNTSLTLLISHELRCGFRQIVTPALEDDASSLVANPSDFTKRYGENFVVGFATGALFFGYIRIDASSETARQTINASMSGSYGLAFSGDAAMKLSNAMAKTASTCETNIYYEGGAVQHNANPATPAELLAAHQEWLSTILLPDGKPSDLVAPYSALLLPYSVALGPQPPNVAQLEHQHDVLVYCSKLRSSTMDKMNLLRYIVDHPREFLIGPGEIGLDAISALASRLAADLEQISATASYSIDHPDKAQMPEEFNKGAPEALRPADGLYVFATVPPNLPKHTGASSVTVPDFRQCPSWGVAYQLATSLRLTLHSMSVDPLGPWKVLSQDPPAGSDVNPDATVTLTVPSKLVVRYNV